MINRSKKTIFVSFITLCLVLTFISYIQARDTSSLSSIQDRDISKFIHSFTESYKKGDVDEYMRFYSKNVIENGGNTFDKIKAEYVYLVNNNIVTLYELKISNINELGDSIVVDALYNRTLIEKSSGDALINSGNVRIRLFREDSRLKIIAIDYDRYIQSDYIIGAEDILDVSVWKSPDLSTTVIVRPDGKISLPLIGEIKAAGRSPKELKVEVEKKLKQYVQEPIVSVIVREVNSKVIYVTGEVNRPGKYPLKSETTVVQAITLAGGFTQWANKDKIVIIRKSPLNPEGIRFTIRYSDIVSGTNMRANMILHSGDTVIVP